MPRHKRDIYSNTLAGSLVSSPSPGHDPSSIINFHRSLPSYETTPVHSLPSIAQEIGVASIFVKDETSRLGLPSFKILGASWAIHLALCAHLSLSPSSALSDVSDAAKYSGIELVAATDGNHGRAVANTARNMGLPPGSTKIFVPDTLDSQARSSIVGEGAEIIPVQGDYDIAVNRAASYASGSAERILIQDTAFEGYTEIPQWIVDGYSTLLVELYSQLPTPASVIVVPVGVGSLAQAVVSHYKTTGCSTKILTVESNTAACLQRSLTEGILTTIITNPTIMTGLNCGTVSSAAWPVLKAGVDVSVTATDWEAHEAVEELRKLGIGAGPCGGATLAGLKRVAGERSELLGLNKDSVVVLLCTEGERQYDIPEKWP